MSFQTIPWRINKPSVGYGVGWDDPINKALLLDWLFNEGAGKTAKNLTGHGITGTLSGNAAWKPGDSGPCLSVAGGATDYVSGPAVASSVIPSAWTVCALVNRATNAGSSGIVHWSPAASPNSSSPFILLRDVAGTLSWWFNGGYQIVDFTALVTGVWTHIALTYGGASNFTAYVNGVSAGTSPVPDTANKSTATTLYAGIGFAGSWIGRIARVQAYSRALTVAEVRRLTWEHYAGVMGIQEYLPDNTVSAGTFQPAWAVNSNVILGGGIYA